MPFPVTFSKIIPFFTAQPSLSFLEATKSSYCLCASLIISRIPAVSNSFISLGSSVSGLMEPVANPVQYLSFTTLQAATWLSTLPMSKEKPILFVATKSSYPLKITSHILGSTFTPSSPLIYLSLCPFW
jgi:hypothetical protein